MEKTDWTPIILLGAIAAGGYLLYKSGIFQGLQAVGGGINTISGLPGQVQQGIGDWWHTSTTPGEGFLSKVIIDNKIENMNFGKSLQEQQKKQIVTHRAVTRRLREIATHKTIARSPLQPMGKAALLRQIELRKRLTR